MPLSELRRWAHRPVVAVGLGGVAAAWASGCGESRDIRESVGADGSEGAPCRSFDEVRFGAAACDGRLRCVALPSAGGGEGPTCRRSCSVDADCSEQAEQICNFGLCVVAGSADDCSTALLTPSERALTPRSDSKIEYLALALSQGIVADQATYERLERDIAAIRQLRPELEKIGYRNTDGESLGLQVPLPVLNDMEHGRYRHWDCLNRIFRVATFRYDVSILSFADSEPFVRLEFEGVYDLERVAEGYRALPAILSVDRAGLVGDASSLCVAPVGSDWQYVFDEAGGDCPAGCTEHRFHYFQVNEAGDVSAGEPWETGDGAEQAVEPAWVAPFTAAGYALEASGDCRRDR